MPWKESEAMRMTPEQVKTELGELDRRIGEARDPSNYAEALQLRQAKQRAELLRAELKRLATAPAGATEEN
jgi:hypothetical protein